MAVPTDQSAKPPRNRRSLRSHEAIIAATLDALNRVGYHDLTIEGVAAAAGVGKSTVYRWWPSKGALVAEAVTSRLKIVTTQMTGDTRGDLITALKDTIANYTHHGDGVEVPALASDLARDPMLLRSFRERFVTPSRLSVAAILHHAMASGQLPGGLDLDLIFDMWAGAIFYRALLGHARIEDQMAEQLVDSVLGAYLRS